MENYELRQNLSYEFGLNWALKVLTSTWIAILYCTLAIHAGSQVDLSAGTRLDIRKDRRKRCWALQVYVYICASIAELSMAANLARLGTSCVWVREYLYIPPHLILLFPLGQKAMPILKPSLMEGKPEIQGGKP